MKFDPFDNKLEASRREYFEVVHLNDDGTRGGCVANESADSITEAMAVIDRKLKPRNPGMTEENRQYWARQRYGIQRVVKVIEPLRDSKAVTVAGEPIIRPLSREEIATVIARFCDDDHGTLESLNRALGFEARLNGGTGWLLLESEGGDGVDGYENPDCEFTTLDNERYWMNAIDVGEKSESIQMQEIKFSRAVDKVLSLIGKWQEMEKNRANGLDSVGGDVRPECPDVEDSMPCRVCGILKANHFVKHTDGSVTDSMEYLRKCSGFQPTYAFSRDDLVKVRIPFGTARVGLVESVSPQGSGVRVRFDEKGEAGLFPTANLTLLAKNGERAPEKSIQSSLDRPGLCPVCDSPDIVGRSVDIEDGNASQSVTCGACEASWLDVYRLSAVLPVSGFPSNWDRSPVLPVVTVTVRGGLVDSVDVPQGVVVKVRDYDAEGSDEDLLSTDNDGDKYIESEWVFDNIILESAKQEGERIADAVLPPKEARSPTLFTPVLDFHDDGVYSLLYDDIDIMVDRNGGDDNIEIRVWRNGKNEEVPFHSFRFDITGD